MTHSVPRFFSALRTTALFAGTVASAGAHAQASPRERIRFDAGWRFMRGAETTHNGPGPFRWAWSPAKVSELNVVALPADLEGNDWRPVELGTGVLEGARRFAWYRTDLGSDPANAGRVLHFESVDDNALVFLNGKRVFRQIGFGVPFDVPLREAWNTSGPNKLVVLVENTGGEGGINGAVTIERPDQADTAPNEARPGFNDRGWRTVHLPHDYVVEGTFRQGEEVSHGSLPRPMGWYRKTFTAPTAWRGKSVWIDFDGVYRNADVYLNGKKLGNEPSGYIGFRFDIGPALNYGGTNVLAVKVDPRRAEGWWYEGGGIYRHVWMNVADPVHVAPWGVFARAEVKGPETASTPPAEVTVTTDLTGGTGTVTLVSRVLGPDGRQVGQASDSLPAGGHGEQRIAVPQAALWSIERPQLYHVETRVLRNGKLVDRVETPFGIRTMRWDKDQGFFLNGKPVKLKGTCNHQDHAGVGVAMPDGLLDWRIRKLKEMGSNAYRCSHNPPAPELLDACDRLGMLVMDETRHLGDSQLPKSPRGTTADDLSELKSMVRRDRNHPSVILWSLFNEEPLQATEEGAQIFLKMQAAVRALDPTRLCSGAANYGYDRGIVDVADLFGFNYNIGAYDGLHRRKPDLPLFGSETASTVSTRGIYANDPERGYVSAYDVNHPQWAETAENAWRPIAERPWMAGAFVWTGFDYKGEPTPYGWPCINSHFGILDICGFPKDNFYYYQAVWGDKPVVHILPHWNWTGKEGQEVSVWVHSNAERVELLLNGKSLGVHDVPPYGHAEWKVPYTPGILEARGIHDGKTIATDKVETTGAPAAIRLKTTRPRLLADAEDLAPVEVEILDAQGRVVPVADNLVTFTVEGPGAVAGVGNGDPSSHEPDKASQRHAFNGLCMALVQSTNGAGRVTLRATSPGLKAATIVLTTAGKFTDR